MCLLSSTLLWHENLISSPHALVHDILQWTWRWNKDNRLHPRFICGDNSLITCSRLEMFTLNIWDVFQLPLRAIFVLTVFLVKKNVLYIYFLLCAFVAKRNSSYRKPCHQHWSEWCGKGFWLLEMSFCTYNNPNIFPICLALMVWVLSWRSLCTCESVNIKG